MKHIFRIVFLSVTTIMAVLAFTAATYAWFSSNKSVSTDTVTARTGEKTLELLLSSSESGGFSSTGECPITQVNDQDEKVLMPVSTADLTEFVYAPFTDGGMAATFERVENEKYIYHGRIYLMAQGKGHDESSRLNLYLDQSDGVLGQDVDGELLNASRLGLAFDDEKSTRVILRLSEKENAGDGQVFNTVVGGTTLGKNEVLQYQGGRVSAVADPSVPVEDYTVSFENNGMKLPEKPLLQMELNRVYKLDIYFYLEGCDPDCSSSVELDEADLYFAFYGVLDREEG